jgi:hypothetical protein
MTKGKAKIKISDILTQYELGDIDMCEVGCEIAKVLDKIYIDLCEDSCAEESNCKDIC